MSGLDDHPAFEFVEDDEHQDAMKRLIRAGTFDELAAAVSLARAWLASGPHPQRLVDEINREIEWAGEKVAEVEARRRAGTW
ncbi:MAG: hypothetical protein KJ056_11025 [Acidimicrobiia bacterium]|nr:hypothetical protein [Acidimicrobiia bacterium]